MVGTKAKRAFWAKVSSKDTALVDSVVYIRHGTVNSCRIKWNGLTDCFRHSLDMYGRYFYAVANIVHFTLEHESYVFEIDYYEY